MKYIIFSLIGIVSYLLLSCNKEDSLNPEGKIVVDTKITNPLYEIQTWIFLSDENGNTIKTIETNNEYEEITFGGSEPTPYWISIAKYYYGYNGEFVINSKKYANSMDTLGFLSRPQPKAFGGLRYQSGSSVLGNTYINVEKLSATVHSLCVSSQAESDYIKFGVVTRKDDMPITMYQDVSDFYISLMETKNSEPKYMSVANVSQKDTIILDPLLFKNYEYGFNINLPIGSSLISQTAGIRNNAETFVTFYMDENNTDFFPVRYVDDSFVKYGTDLRIYLPTTSRNVNYSEVSTTPLNKFELVTTTFNYQLDNRNMSYSYSGNSSLAGFGFEDANDYNNWWLIYTDPKDNAFIIPEIPESISSQLPTGVLSSLILHDNSFYNFSFLNNYEEVAAFGNSSFSGEYTYYSDGFITK